jgi:hypothetical protein
MAQKGTDFDNVRTGNRSDKPKITDKINLFKFPEKKWVTFRFFGPTFSYATGWVKTKTKDGKPTKFPVSFPSYDPDTQQFDTTKYDPWYAIVQEEEDIRENDKKTVQVAKKFYCNALSRAAQKQQPSRLPKPTAAERKSGHKDKDSETWTPWVALALPGGAIRKLAELKPLNTVTSKKTGSTTAYAVSHDKFGCDVRIMFDSTKAPAEQYSVQIGERSPLTEEELAFLTWDLSDLAAESTEEETKRDYESWAKRMGIKVKSKGKKAAEDDYEEDEDLDEEDEDEDDEPAPKKGKGKPAPAKKAAPAKGKGKKAAEEDEEDEDEESDDFDDEDEDEDDAPPPKKGKAAPAKKGKKVEEDEEDEDDFGDDEDEDEDSDDEDDQDSEDEDDDLDDEDEDEDEDDEPAPKKGAKKAPAKKPVAKGKKAAVEEDEDEDEDSDDEDEDDFDDEDEDEAPPPKKGAKKPVAKAPAKKTAAKSKKVVEEEDEDDDDFDDEDEDEDDEPPARKKAPVKKARR